VAPKLIDSALAYRVSQKFTDSSLVYTQCSPQKTDRQSVTKMIDSSRIYKVSQELIDSSLVYTAVWPQN